MRSWRVAASRGLAFLAPRRVCNGEFAGAGIMKHRSYLSVGVTRDRDGQVIHGATALDRVREQDRAGREVRTDVLWLTSGLALWPGEPQRGVTLRQDG